MRRSAVVTGAAGSQDVETAAERQERLSARFVGRLCRIQRNYRACVQANEQTLMFNESLASISACSGPEHVVSRFARVCIRQ